MIVGGVDTYYDYDEHLWKFRRLGGGPVHPAPVCPATGAKEYDAPEPPTRYLGHRMTSPQNLYDRAAEG